MVLGSQSPRSGGSSARTRRRGRKGGGKLKYMVIAGLIGGGAWWYFADDSEPVVVMPQQDPNGIANASLSGPATQTMADTPAAPQPANPTDWRITPELKTPQPQAAVATPQAPPQARTTPLPTDVARDANTTPARPLVPTAVTTQKQPALAPRKAEPAPKPKQEFTQTINQVVGMQPQNFADFDGDGPARLRADLATALTGGMKLIEQGDWIQGRRALSDLLRENELQLPAADAQAIRDVLMSVNQKLIFSRQVYQGDPLTTEYKIASGDFLSTIAPRYDTTFELLGKVNNINPNRIRLGQRIKIVRGPMHAVVDKSAFRMDVYSTADGGKPLYVTTFAIGCGEDNSTPVGNFIVSKDGKIPNPAWNNPRTGERFGADDPKNPIGEYWLGLTGTDEMTTGLRGYGIHGTIVPDSIGKNMSMGCVRLRPDDIEMVYSLLIPVKSTVTIRP